MWKRSIEQAEEHMEKYQETKPKRFGIFAFYEKSGKIEDYVVYLLKELKKSLQELVFVSNGELSAQGLQVIEGIVDTIIIRDNKGYDAGAFREVILDAVATGHLNDYDELVLCNDTFFGPFVPFENIFSDMEGRKLDFWGLSAQPEALDFWTGSDNIVPAFIQSFFVVINKKMFSDVRFVEFWKDLSVDKWNLTQVVKNYEQRFTTYFESIGYSWGTYTDNRFFEGTPQENIFTPYLMIPYELIKYGNCPFLKKKCITGKDIAQGMEPDNCSFAKALKYVEMNTDYDMDLILRYMHANCSEEVIADKLKNYSDIKVDDAEEFNLTGLLPALEEGSITSSHKQRILEFCKNQDKLYLYGTGGVATRTGYDLIKKGIHFDGFVVSDGQNAERELIGHKVYYISEVDLEKAGVVISVEERLYNVITKVLDDKGFENYIYSCY